MRNDSDTVLTNIQVPSRTQLQTLLTLSFPKAVFIRNSRPVVDLMTRARCGVGQDRSKTLEFCAASFSTRKNMLLNNTNQSFSKKAGG